MPRVLRRAADDELSTLIRSAKIKGVLRRDAGGKHYVYVTRVVLEDGSQHTVYRRYSRFVELYAQLEAAATASGFDPAGVLPTLPGKKIVGRSHVRKVAQERVSGLNEFLDVLFNGTTPAKIATCAAMVAFLTRELEDYEEEGPGAYLEVDGPSDTAAAPPIPVGESVLDGPHCKVVLDYFGEAAGGTGLNLAPGDIVRLTREVGAEYFEGEIDGVVGTFPRSCIEVVIPLQVARASRVPPSAPAPKRTPPAMAAPKRDSVEEAAATSKRPPGPSRPEPPRPSAPAANRPPRVDNKAAAPAPGAGALRLPGFGSGAAKKPSRPSVAVTTKSSAQKPRRKEPGPSSSAPAAGPGVNMTALSSVKLRPPPLPSGTAGADEATRPAPGLATSSVKLRPTPSSSAGSTVVQPTPADSPFGVTLKSAREATSAGADGTAATAAGTDSNQPQSRALVGAVQPFRQRSNTDSVTASLSYSFQGKSVTKRLPNWESDLVQDPSFKRLLAKMRRLLRKTDIVINYVDDEGDLIAVHDDDDLALFVAERPPEEMNQLDIVVTIAGDYAPYRTPITG